MRIMKNKVFTRMVAFLLAFTLFALLLPTADISAANDIAQIGIDLKVVNSSGSPMQVDEIATGETFYLKLSYTIAPAPSADGTYKDPLITISLPNFINVVSMQNDSGKIITSMTEEKFPNHYISCVLTPELNAGAAGSVVVAAKFNNFVTEDDLLATFRATMTGTFKVGDVEHSILKPNGDPLQTEPVTIKSAAGDVWDINKTVTDIKTVGSDYHVTFRLDANVEGGFNRYGRLELDKFILTDTLPGPKGSNATGYLPGGGAVLVNVKDKDGKDLEKGTDYTTTTGTDALGDSVRGYDEPLETVQFTKWSTLALESGQAADTYLVPEGSSIDTTYYVTVRYPKEKYLKPSNIPLVQDEFVNNAKLVYSLKTVDSDVEKNANADFKLGEKETPPTPRSITVQKSLKIGSYEFNLTDAYVKKGYERATFSLFSNPACGENDYAKDFEGNDMLDKVKDITTDSLGKVIFPNLRHGTYYLKETYTPDGFTENTTITQISLSSEGKVSYGSNLDVAEVKITNVAEDDGMGIVEFWKVGQGAASTDYKWLKDITFTLTEKGNPTNTKTAKSEDGGYVRFDAVKDGTYILKETSLGANSPEYTILLDAIEFKVNGNEINHPPSTNPGATAGKPATLLNQSEKGMLEITKKDADTPNAGLVGAEFDLYGPYADTVTKLPDHASSSGTIKMTSATQTFGPYTKGKYFLVETKAPKGYTLDPTPIAVTIAQNDTCKIDITNIQNGAVIIEKWGKMNGGAYPVALGGIKFEIHHDNTGNNPVKVKNAQGIEENLVITSSVDATGNPNTKAVELPEGTYYYKEVASSVPAGYTPIEGYHAFSVSRGLTTPKTVKIDNAMFYGRIRVYKVNSVTNAPLEGVVFDIYDNEACEGTPSATMTTEDDGYAMSQPLPVGKYFIKERAYTGYVQPIKIIKGKDG
ncbi:hypothetical protein LJB83_03015, partial [Clostridia bacterium OttesenSCG-928-F22]|nr:hypothetical protein [Clostridia bacterium OttesenSCG-928-F22]